LTLTLKALFTKARNRVSVDTNLTISVERLLTVASNSRELHPFLEFNVPVLNIAPNAKYKAVLERRGFHPHFQMIVPPETSLAASV
jgi:hypothetical protein